MTTRIAWLWLFIALGASGAEHFEVLLIEDRSLRLSFVVRLPPSGKILPPVSGAQTHGLRIMIEDDREGGIVIESRSGLGKTVWSHDFGYNASAPNAVSVESSAVLNAFIIRHEGYKWDRKEILLFAQASRNGGETQVSEYKTAEKDLLPTLAKHPQSQKGFAYHIHPSGFRGELVVFSCIPLAKGNAPHPFHQDQTLWLTVEARLNGNRAIEPVRVVPNEDISKKQ